MKKKKKEEEEEEEYHLELTYPGSEQSWCTLEDYVQRLKEESMESAIFVGHTDEMLQDASQSTDKKQGFKK